jgi:hypothetical protein
VTSIRRQPTHAKRQLSQSLERNRTQMKCHRIGFPGQGDLRGRSGETRMSDSEFSMVIDTSWWLTTATCA